MAMKSIICYHITWQILSVLQLEKSIALCLSMLIELNGFSRNLIIG